MAARSYGQYCGVTNAVELVGERWALLIVRDLLVGPRRYTDLKQGLPRIPTNILSTRLKELQDAGVVRRVPLRHGDGCADARGPRAPRACSTRRRIGRRGTDGRRPPPEMVRGVLIRPVARWQRAERSPARGSGPPDRPPSRATS